MARAISMHEELPRGAFCSARAYVDPTAMGRAEAASMPATGREFTDIDVLPSHPPTPYLPCHFTSALGAPWMGGSPAVLLRSYTPVGSTRWIDRMPLRSDE